MEPKRFMTLLKLPLMLRYNLFSSRTTLIPLILPQQLHIIIGNDSHVRLNIFNSLGQKVKTLVNDYKPAGQYQVNFDASGIASGIYIARIEAGGYTKMIKMNLLK